MPVLFLINVQYLFVYVHTILINCIRLSLLTVPSGPHTWHMFSTEFKIYSNNRG